MHSLHQPARCTWNCLALQVGQIARYAGRLLLALFLLELLTHSIYANATSRFHLWDRLSAEQSERLFNGLGMAAFAFYKLIFLWLKFVVIWRVARLIALLDGVDPPENMLRCALLTQHAGCTASS